MFRDRIVRAAELMAPGLLFKLRVAKYASVEPEQKLVQYLCDKQHIAIDVGANIGIYSGLMVRYAKACHAFEANPRLADQLRRAAVPGLTVTHAAVSDRSGEITLHIPRSRHGLGTVEQENATLDSTEFGPVDRVTVRSIRLDDLSFDSVNLIKIDVEGHEEAVLRGAAATLAKHRPFLIIESENRRKPGVLDRLFRALGAMQYSGFFLRDGLLRSLDTFDAKRDQDPEVLERVGVSAYTYNFVFAPNEQTARLASLPLPIR